MARLRGATGEDERRAEGEVMSKILSVNRRSLPSPDGYGEYLVVLVEGDIGDYAAYYAGGNDPEWAARYGNKISFEEACCHFMPLSRERYRD